MPTRTKFDKKRLLEMCAPILFTGTNFRKQTAQSKLDKLKTMMKEKECL